jgi:hypothetical protein
VLPGVRRGKGMSTNPSGPQEYYHLLVPPVFRAKVLACFPLGQTRACYQVGSPDCSQSVALPIEKAQLGSCFA